LASAVLITKANHLSGAIHRVLAKLRALVEIVRVPGAQRNCEKGNAQN